MKTGTRVRLESPYGWLGRKEESGSSMDIINGTIATVVDDTVHLDSVVVEFDHIFGGKVRIGVPIHWLRVVP